MNTKDIVIRDPFILADEGKYYLYGTRSETAWGHGDGFDVYESSDLEEWTGPAEIFRRPADFWADKEFWAPECIRKGDKYYLIATFGTEGKPKGIQILESDTPAGPFALLTECPITPKDWNCLDGTVYTDASGTSWLVFSHSFPQEPGGAITAARLSDDMTRLVSEEITIFQTVRTCSTTDAENCACFGPAGQNADMRWAYPFQKTESQARGFMEKRLPTTAAGTGWYSMETPGNPMCCGMHRMRLCTSIPG